MPVTPIDTDQIVITASRAPEEEARTPASVTIIDQRQDRAARRAAGPCPAPADALGGDHRARPDRTVHRGPHPRRREQPHPAVHRRHPRQRPGNRRLRPVRVAQRRPRLADRGRARAAVGAVGLGSDRRSHRDQRCRRPAGLWRSCRGRLVRLPAGQRVGRVCLGPRKPRRRDRLAARDRHRQLRRRRRQGRLSQPVGPAARNRRVGPVGRARCFGDRPDRTQPSSTATTT